MADKAGDPSALLSSQSNEVSIQKSYANAVGSKPSLTKFEVDVKIVDGKATVAVPDEIFTDSVPLWDEFLVGRFPSTSPAPHVAKIHVIVNKIWNLGDKSIRIDAYSVNKTIVKFRIRNVSARLRVLRRGMWNICDLPMIVSKWTPFPEEAQSELRMMPMWVTIKNVPHSMFTWKGLSYIVSPVGEPKRLHPDTELVTSFDEAKIFVEVNLQKELPTTYYFNVQGDEVCVTFEYPWLPPKCGTCGKWGHSSDSCLANLGKSQTSPTKTTPTSAKNLNSQASPVKSTPAATENSNSQASLVETTSAVAKNPNSASHINGSTSTTAPDHISVSVVADIVKNNSVETSEKEEGEISSPSRENSVAATDGEWTEVSASGSRKSEKSAGKELVYGQVRIASPTSFDILRDTVGGEEDNILNPKENINNIELAAAHTTQQKPKSTGSNTAVRVTLPRNSKNSHKFLSDSTQKAKDSLPSGISKKKTKAKP